MPEIPERLKQLVDTFSRNIDSYKSGNMNETQLRREFIDPFFISLGWDVENRKGYADAYKDVIHEYSLKTKDVREAPDYCFRIGGTRKFFLEAKKPSVNVKEDIHPAFQVRSYAWSAKLPLSILTDFEEFAVYDCRIPPHKNDKASVARVMYFTYDQYLENWEEIAGIFSRDSVLKGSFDKYVESNKKKKGTAEVDSVFLDQMEEWRKLIARNIALRNPSLTIRELNFAVQKTIDRIIFLRICEDRGIEDYGQLMSLQNGNNVYERLKQIFQRADEKYNSGLFHFDEEKDRAEEPDNLSLTLQIDDKVLKDIFSGLYYPESPYEFSVLPSDILGQVYEQFLGKVIRLTTSHQAVVDDKPEVKKAGGVYYTPTYIVNYIVENTLGKLLTPPVSSPSKKGRTKEGLPTVKEVSKLKILDPACGSGSFLIGAFQYLLDWHLKEYTANDESIKKYSSGRQPAIYQAEKIGWLLTTAEKKRILLNNIYGVDIDSQAVEVTKLSLLLKVLEGESEETINNQLNFFHERALPDLAHNIKCGNSLIGSDFYDQMEMNFLNDEEKLRINVFDWKTEFKEIMDNGRFDVVIGNPPYGADLTKDERNYLKIKFDENNSDTAAYFLLVASKLISNRNYFGFIIPKSFSYASNWQDLRQKLINDLVQIVDCSKVWTNVKYEMVISIFIKNSSNNFYDSYKRTGSNIRKIGSIDKALYKDFDFVVNGVSNEEINLGIKIKHDKSSLNYYVSNDRGGMFQKEVKGKGDLKVLGGKQINRYFILNEIKGKVSAQNLDIDKSLIRKNSILVQNIIAHIANPIPHIKITATAGEFIIDQDNYAILDTVNQLTNKSNYSSLLFLAILNSKLINWYCYKFIFGNAIRTMHFDSPTTAKIPIPSEEGLKSNETIINDIVGKVEIIKDLYSELHKFKTPHEKISKERELGILLKQIDQLVYQLYGLTEDEIRIVEGENV